jgi:glycosyltransferase involved in cell wall biosynthesis
MLMSAVGSDGWRAAVRAVPRVAHVTSVHPPDDPRIFAKECRTLAAAGYDVHLVSPLARDGIRDGVRLWGIRTRHSSRRSARMTGTVARIVAVARRLDADVYHLHDPELLPPGLLLAAMGKRVIYDAHEDVPSDILLKPWIRPRLRAPISRLAAGIEHAAGWRFAAVIGATPTIAARFAAFARETACVSNFPQLAEFSSGAHEAARENAVCYVGSISELRGASTMVRAMAATDARLLLAGRFSPPDLTNRLAGCPGWSQVDVLGHVDRAGLAATLARSRAGLAVLAPVPTYVVSQPTKLYEYMAAGLPVIASNFPGWRKIVEGNQCGTCVDPSDPGAVAHAIRGILSHPEDADAMGRNGRRAVERDYSWERQGRMLTELYERVLR